MRNTVFKQKCSSAFAGAITPGAILSDIRLSAMVIEEHFFLVCVRHRGAEQHNLAHVCRLEDGAVVPSNDHIDHVRGAPQRRRLTRMALQSSIRGIDSPFRRVYL
jgi:hypothetical protein